MKKIIISLLCLCLVGCSNGLKEDYERVVKENKELKTEVKTLENQLHIYGKELEKYTLNDEKGNVKISGGLVLKVEAKLMDPVVDPNSFEVLVVRPFQSIQEILFVDKKIAQQVEIGNTYFFEMETKIIEDVSLNEVVDTINLDLGARQFLKVISVRDPKEDEYGLAENLHIEKVDK